MTLDYQLIGKRLAACRKARGLKQREVCEAADINDKYLSNIEHARSIPSLEVVLRLCSALDITPNEILLNCSIAPEAQQAQELAKRIMLLKPEQVQLLSDVVDCMQMRNTAAKTAPSLSGRNN